jgi:hypothetical protein
MAVYEKHEVISAARRRAELTKTGHGPLARRPWWIRRDGSPTALVRQRKWVQGLDLNQRPSSYEPNSFPMNEIQHGRSDSIGRI